MCDAATGSVTEATLAAPRAAYGDAVDPIGLEPVDEVVVTTLVDNVYDALLPGDDRVTRTAFGTAGFVDAPQFEGGGTAAGLRAEHGFSALVSVRRGAITTSLLFDTGLSPDAMVVNAERLGVDLSSIQGVVLSHGHFDHAGGLSGLARVMGDSMPMVVHPMAWTRRRLNVPGAEPIDFPTLSRRALEAEGFALVERREPSLLVDGCVLVTGEVDRTTDFEHGMPRAHEALAADGWRHDPDVVDDQALVVNLRGRGLVVLTGCGHAGVVNIVRHAQRLTGVSDLHALVGGLHLSGPAFEPIIAPTVDAVGAWAPSLLVPGHCTGWRAQHALAAALPDAWVAGSSGTSYRLTAA